MSGHYILCGLGKVGAHVLDYLRVTGKQIIVIDSRDMVGRANLEGVTYIRGDCRQPQVLVQAGIERAAGILIVTSDDLVNFSATLLAHDLNPKVRVVVRMFNQELIRRLGPRLQNVTALSTSALTAPVLAMLAQSGEVLGAFTLQPAKRMQVLEIVLRARSPWCGQKLGEVLQRQGIHAVGHRVGDKPYQVLGEVDGDAVLASTDRLIVCGEVGAVGQLRTSGEPEAEPELLWAGFFVRQWRAVQRTFAEIDLAVKICTLVLIAAVLLSTLLFHVTMRNDTVPDAFYRTISLMATAADLGLRGLEPEGWQKIYVSLLRVAGAALIAAFTAILTNYLLRAQLKGALEIRRIPEGGHIVVCGLGNVGIRVVKELVEDGENVVVVERNANNPFIPAARRKKVAVMISDATVPEVLKEAHAGTAKAVIAATNNELVNVEIALVARHINARQRVVLRLTDTQLARTLREAAHIRLAVSIPDLAAPAFVAALFGDHVHCVFFIEGRLLAVVRVTVDAEDSRFLGRHLSELTREYGLRPVAWTRGEPATGEHSWEEPIARGDCLTVIVELSNLQRLLRSETVAAK